MDKPKIMINDSFDYEIWYKTYDPDFIDISIKSMVPYKWLAYYPVAEGKYKDSIIKPINKYVESLYPAPELISISDGVVRLRQKNHAEIFLLHGDGIFRNVDRPWMRQYYQTSESFPRHPECFENFYKFYAPWFVDATIPVRFEPVDDSPFVVYEKEDMYYQVNPFIEFMVPIYVPFAFKNVGSHMVQENFGKIKRGSNMFDIVFRADAIMEEKIREFYEHN